MGRTTSISTRWPAVTLIAVTLSLLIIGMTVSVTVGAVTGLTAYYLLGDGTNSGVGATVFNSTTNGDAWTFTATGSSATSLIGNCPNGDSCWGVQGKGTGKGVYGNASNPATSGSLMGVEGNGGTTGSNGTSYGGYFNASNSASGGKAIGVYGTGPTAGVSATSSTNAVRATTTGTGGNGVFATGSGSSVYGLWGDVGGGGYGVVGSSSGNIGVYGTTTGTTTSTANVAGVYGYDSLSSVGTASATNSGVFGNCPYCNGVFGTSTNYVGVRGTATGPNTNTYGGYFTAQNGTGISASTTNGGTALYAINGNKTSGHFAGYFDGNVWIKGNYVATGTKSAVVSTTQGNTLMYAEEATQNYFSDQGVGTLKRGRVVISIDPLFAQTVDLSKPYMVIVTPMSFDTAGLGVGNLGATSFEVRELSQGKGNFTFSWRITALRKGYTDVRMATLPSFAPPTMPLPTGPSTVAPPTQKAPPAALPPAQAAGK